jgi:hypothetical protein
MNHMMIDYVVKLHLHKYLIFIGSCYLQFCIFTKQFMMKSFWILENTWHICICKIEYISVKSWNTLFYGELYIFTWNLVFICIVCNNCTTWTSFLRLNLIMWWLITSFNLVQGTMFLTSSQWCSNKLICKFDKKIDIWIMKNNL